MFVWFWDLSQLSWALTLWGGRPTSAWGRRIRGMPRIRLQLERFGRGSCFRVVAFPARLLVGVLETAPSQPAARGRASARRFPVRGSVAPWLRCPSWLVGLRSRRLRGMYGFAMTHFCNTR